MSVDSATEPTTTTTTTEPVRVIPIDVSKTTQGPTAMETESSAVVQGTYCKNNNSLAVKFASKFNLTLKVPSTTKAEFANTVDPYETAHNEPFHLDLQCLLSSL